MNNRDLKWFVLLQLLAIVIAGSSFALIENRLWAGGVAGGYFLISGLWMLYRVFNWPAPWQSLMAYPLLIHVFVISIPMLITRFANTDRAFKEVRILGLEGPEFHRLSTTIFSLLIGATLIDLVRVWRTQKKSAKAMK